MLEIYTGTVGSGKSYHALLRGINKIYSLKNNLVYANFPIKFTDNDIKRGIDRRWYYYTDDEMEPEFFIQQSFERDFYGKEGHTLLIVDEAAIYFNARDWNVNPKRRIEWVKFFAVFSRRMGYDIIMVSQDEKMVDRQIRSTMEYRVKHVKMRNFSWFKLIPWQVFATVQYWGGGSFKGQLGLLFFNPLVAKRYDTMRLFKPTPEMLEWQERYNRRRDVQNDLS